MFFLFEGGRSTPLCTGRQAELCCAVPMPAARLSLPTISPACTPARAPCLCPPRAWGQKTETGRKAPLVPLDTAEVLARDGLSNTKFRLLSWCIVPRTSTMLWSRDKSSRLTGVGWFQTAHCSHRAQSATGCALRVVFKKKNKNKNKKQNSLQC